MSEIEIRIRVNPRTRQARVSHVSGFDEQGGADSGSGAQLSSASGNGGGGTSKGNNDDSERKMAAVPWWLDPSNTYGSALRRTTSALLDPHMSGEQQQSVIATQGARASAYAASSAALNNPAVAGMLNMAGQDPKNIASAIADAVGAAMEKALERRAVTGEQANQTVGNVVARFARAGLEGQVSDADIQNMLAREKAANEREWDARARVAKASGNFMAGTVNDVQTAVGGAFDQLSGLLGMGVPKNVLDSARRQIEMDMVQSRGQNPLPGR